MTEKNNATKKKVTKKAKIINDMKELKSFILWAKEEKIQSFGVAADGSISVNFATGAFLSDYGTDFDANQEEGDEMPHTDIKDIDDDLLYHSS